VTGRARLRQSWAQSLNPFADAYGVVVLLLLAILLAPVFTAGNADLAVITVALLGGATAVISFSASAVPIWASSATALFAISAAVLTLFSRTPGVLVSVSFLGLGVAMMLAPVAILNRIVRHRFVTPRTVLGAIAVYLQIGVAFSMLYLELFRLDPASFPSVTAPYFGTFQYFSFITLNTVGYGDIVPVDNVGRTLSIFEALIGQIFLVVVVARVVALLGPGPGEKAAASEEQPPTQP
jgi:Ion channel